MKALRGIAALITIAWATTSPAAIDAETICPTLPPESDLSWTFKRGPDFYVCYAERIGADGAGMIGVYLGLAPNFSTKDEAFVREALVDGMPVRWQRMMTRTYTFGLEALRGQNDNKIPPEQWNDLPPPAPPDDLGHIWIQSNDESTLNALRVIAEKLTFKKTN